MDRKSSKLPLYLPLTPLRSHVSHTHAQTDAYSSRAGWRNPNVLINGDKQRQGEHWAALTHRETDSYQWADKDTTQAHLRPLKLPPPSPLPGLSPHLQRGGLSFLLCETESIQGLLNLCEASLLTSHQNANLSYPPLTCLQPFCFLFCICTVVLLICAIVLLFQAPGSAL